ncbi:MAG: hypothetical protein NT075_08965 [Chloroflexi bacterium]|nr:hypothetical protein [Chloroflexota bacterium]
MAKDRTLVRASDIGTWSFCQRAWWLAHIKQVPHQRPQVLQQGTIAHAAHGRAVVQACRLHRVGLFLLAMGLLLAIVTGLFWLWTG